jgi:regulatory LuxR family protein
MHLPEGVVVTQRSVGVVMTWQGRAAGRPHRPRSGVLRLLARGLPGKEIAARLVISPKPVRNHIEHIYPKIGASSAAAASLFAMQHGLLCDGCLVAWRSASL